MAQPRHSAQHGASSQTRGKQPNKRNPTQKFSAQSASGAVVSPVPSHPMSEVGTKHKKSYLGAKVFAGLLLAAGIIYLGGVVYFSGHFYPHTTVANNDVSFKTPAELASVVASKASEYTATISGDGLNLEVKGTDIDLSVNSDALASDAKATQNSFAWPAEVFGNHNISDDVSVTFNSDKLAALLAGPISNINQNATQPTNATLSYDSSSSSFKITDEVAGSAIDEQAALSIISDGITALQTNIELSSSALVQPAITSTSDTIKKAQSAANKFLVGSIKLTFNGSEVATVDNNLVGSWVKVGADGTVALDTDAISTWANDELAPKINTVGTTRTYTRPDGKKISVSGGDYGWQIDAATLASNLATQLQSASNADLEIPTSSTGSTWTALGEQDWSSTYIDVDLTEQHARMYQDGNLVWESDFVSGDISKDFYTPTGVYYVNGNKQQNAKLIGPDFDHDGESDYTSYVDYWIPFVNNLVAFHDAPWRRSFGGTIYNGNGSHGCLNLPPTAAQQLYDLAPVGTVVVVHD